MPVQGVLINSFPVRINQLNKSMKIFTNGSGKPPGFLCKILLIMRLIVICLIFGIVQVSASSFGQVVTVNHNNITIREIFKLIKLQTGYDVLWQPDKLNANKMISAHFNNEPLSGVLAKCLQGTQLKFQIEDKSIIIIRDFNTHTEILLQDSVIYKGKITDEDGKPMAGATVKIIGSARSTFSTSTGSFGIYGPRKGTIEVTYIGYLNKQITLNGLNPSEPIIVSMHPGNNNLGEVNIVSTGYQDIGKERVTGSFEVVTKEQLQHSSDPNIIKRLEGITTSMNFNNQLIPVNSARLSSASTSITRSPLANLTIRGRNTLNFNQVSGDNQSGLVLVVIDGIASPYSIDNINPDDVENITVLKDAAAASVWGSRAANGVIVVKTKRGGYDKAMNISFNANWNISEKMDLFYNKVMSTSDYIDAQIFHFYSAKPNVSNPNLNSPQPFLSPVAEILGRQQNGQINAAQSKIELDALRGNDIRKDFDKYILRNASTQNYSLGIDGGGKMIAYRLSLAYNKGSENTVANNNERISLAYNTSLKLSKKLSLSGGVTYSVRKSEQQSVEQAIRADYSIPYYPYTRLADDAGNPVSIPYKYRPSFIQLLANTYGSKIQDLTFIPLKNIDEGYYRTSLKNLNFNAVGNYNITEFLSANVIYNYGLDDNRDNSLMRKNSFYARDLVSYYTSPAGVQSIPNGGIYNTGVSSSHSQALRAQLNFDSQWNPKHSINAIAGIELAENYYKGGSYNFYGYNEHNLFSDNQLDFKNPVPVLYSTFFGNTGYIPYTTSIFNEGRGRTFSNYANVAYTYNNRYTFSASIRRDLSSAFGNKPGTPFFSFGGKWNLSEEKFYTWDFLPIVQLRSTFGYNGNVNPVITPFPVISYSTTTQNNQLLFASTGTAATNNRLRPEKTGILNLGVDFAFKNRKISGTFEYYNKRTMDLIASNTLDPTTGFNRLNYNTASTQGWGTDFSISSQNLAVEKFSWTTNGLFSYNRVKVTKVFTATPRNTGNIISGVPFYNEGADLSRLYAYYWAGLDPIAGNPMGYVNGVPVVLNNVTKYNAINNQPVSAAHYMGSAVPVYYGSIRNSFRYAGLSVSANVLFKFGYYFRRQNIVDYGSLFGSTQAIQGSEYAMRWQKPGDERFTNVPALVYPAAIGDIFYRYADINVLKADHARLQEVNISYNLTKKNKFIKNPRIYANITNLGVIWRANKKGIDPDSPDYPNPRMYAFGFSANF